MKPKNWEKFQHYKYRRPPWIKLHRELLDDISFLRLQAASRALAPLLWLMASESDDGEVPDDPADIAFRLRLPQDEVEEGVTELLAAGFFLASTPLAPRLHVASETVPQRREELRVKKRESVQPAAADESFDRFWEAYDKKRSKVAALKVWKKIPKLLHEKVIAAARAYAKATPDKQYRKDPTTWLRQQCWDDEILPKKAQGKRSIEEGTFLDPNFDSSSVRSGKL